MSCFMIVIVHVTPLCKVWRIDMVHILMICCVYGFINLCTSKTNYFLLALQTQLLSLLCLGEIGRRKDLSNHTNIEVVVIGSFQSPSEEIKAAASYALGNIAVGNLAQYLPFILSQIGRQAKLQYLLLHSLKEVYMSSLF